jgi:hypothetical protein
MAEVDSEVDVWEMVHHMVLMGVDYKLVDGFQVLEY